MIIVPDLFVKLHIVMGDSRGRSAITLSVQMGNVKPLPGPSPVIYRNPMQLVKVKGSTKRIRRIVIIKREECVAIIGFLPEPYSLMVLICACLGLSVSEMLALQWIDFDWELKTVTINRAFTHGSL